MKLSPLQLEHSFVAESHVTASREFDSTKPADVRADEIIVATDIKPIGEDRRWEVTLRVQFTPGSGVNTPYFFTLELVGFFRVETSYLEDRVQRLIQTNGPSLLFGIAREVLRNLTAHGPHPPMILPTASFVLDHKSPVQIAESSAEAVPEPARQQ
jgi:preprotein translocase subunit SecB